MQYGKLLFLAREGMKTNSVVGNRDRRVAAVEYRAWRVRVKTKIYEFIFTRSGAEITIEW